MRFHFITNRIFCDMDWFWGNLGAKLVIEPAYWKNAKMSQKYNYAKNPFLDMNFYAYLQTFHKLSRFATSWFLRCKILLWAHFWNATNKIDTASSKTVPYTTTAFCLSKFYKRNQYTNWVINSFSFHHW